MAITIAKAESKELDKMHGLNMYDYSARYYEPAIGRFTTVDPLAEKYYSISPYTYCASNPILNIDPDGRDYWSTNDPEKIKQFLNSMGRGSSVHDMSGWNHATDAEFVGKGTLNDETGKFHTSYASYENGVATVTGVTLDTNIKPGLTSGGFGYPGAFVYRYSSDGSLYKAGYDAAQFGEISAFVAEFITPFDPNNYFDGVSNWNVNTSGRLIGVYYIQEAKKVGGGKASAKALKGLVQQAISLSHKIGKNSVKMRTTNVMYHYDLRGPAHKGVLTPHVQRSLPNIDTKGVLHWNKDSKWVRPMTQQEIRMIRKSYGF
ncbi:RHS repeat-associated core domain-containing protein [Dysgonomonas sp. BGC7]|uniref:RHS repeat-associated core domain-containing protein n=1 Tax=Dysgonomonas sp. BGC7 TaxID=1658008 RepID=UPI000683638F|nr:RHS repeat-associated core domain-containing protein [Dysgonomonas sp. BGC7]MBD8389038.1 hypothetical protein [Dysgonomonas sp. BGC7]